MVRIITFGRFEDTLLCREHLVIIICVHSAPGESGVHFRRSKKEAIHFKLDSCKKKSVPSAHTLAGTTLIRTKVLESE